MKSSAERAKRWRLANPSRLKQAQRATDLKRYGLTTTQYDQMFAAQQGLCAICHLPETVMFCKTIKLLAVDHNHVTGNVRGLLCSSCNQGLGRFKDSPDRLRAAACYLERI